MSRWTELWISAGELAAKVDGPRPPVLLDVRFDPRTGALPDDYAVGHLPGAVFVDLPVELAGDASGGGGRFPLPEIGRLQAAARRWGIRTDSDVVVYDDRSGISAARAVWVLRWAGVDRVRLMDGGLRAWRRLGHPVATDVVVPIEGDIDLAPGSLPSIGAETAAAFGAAGSLLDARPNAAYAKGHVPGAIGLPSDATLDEHGLVRPPDELRTLLADAGVPLGHELAVYCGAGISAAYAALVLSHLGEDVALYVGSWSDWSADPTRPVVTT
ncbi:sulfurtransferase [Agromyces sp. NPDC056523]|uniref:sulfurtransferase n=1 Tax=Agromyces sp. NPDC056523 TaxID=3345850 RepID=UPI00366EA86A